MNKMPRSQSSSIKRIIFPEKKQTHDNNQFQNNNNLNKPVIENNEGKEENKITQERLILKEFNNPQSQKMVRINSLI